MPGRAYKSANKEDNDTETIKEHIETESKIKMRESQGQADVRKLEIKN